MGIIREILYFSAVLIMCTPAAHGQLDAANIKAQPIMPTWETYDFIRYGNIGASLYTGTINYSVPIYSYKDADFTYSLSADYSTNGFRVNQPSGVLGLGWSLSCPGKIVREINEIPDEYSKTVIGISGVGCTLEGYRRTSAERYTKNYLCHQTNTLYPCLISESGTKYFEAQPDVYSFNFCGFSGQFRRDRLSQENEKVCLFNLSSNSISLKVLRLDEQGSIKIQDGNGYMYTFEVESYYYDPQHDGVDAPRQKVYKSWCLKDITAPNGRQLVFLYQPISENLSVTSDNSISYFPTLRYNFTICAGVNADCNTETKAIKTVENIIYNNKFIGVILPDGESVSVNYRSGTPELRYISPENNTTAVVRGNCQRISDIEIKFGGSLIKRASFGYKVETGNGVNSNNSYTFLKSIDITGTGRHYFDYYAMAGYPPLATTRSDHWGYFNGNSAGINTADFFSNLILNENSFDESYSSCFKKSPDFEAALSGSLKTINYPTGGYSTIEYESHDCSQKLNRNSDTFFIPTLSDVQENGNRTNMQVGGIRLKQIVNYAGTNVPVDTIRYVYTDDASSRLSSGILIDTPRYGLKYKVNNGSATKNVAYFSLTNSMFDYNHTHIEYGHVREIRSNAGYKDFYYTDYRYYPDYITDAGEIKDNDNSFPAKFCFSSSSGNPMEYIFSNPGSNLTNLLTPVASGQIRRGLLKEERLYSDAGVLKKRTVHSYSFPLVKTDTVLTITGEVVRDIYYPRYNISLDGTTEYEYRQNGPVVTSSEFEYNDFGSVAVKTVTKSDGKIVRDRFYYSGDKSVTDAVADTMKAEKVNGIMLRQERFEIDNGIETMTEGLRYSYFSPAGTNPKLFRPAKIELWGPVSGWTSEETYRYDDNGLLTQVTDSAGVATSFLWSYAGRYPVIMANKLSFTELKSAIGSMGLDYETLRDSYEPDAATLNSLRSMVRNSTAGHISLYTYKPTSGMTESQLPNGLKTYYNYDGYSRLTDIKDNNGSVTEHSEYNIISVMPFSAVFQIPTSCHVNQEITVSATASGGSSSYQYSLKLTDSDNITRSALTSQTGIFVIDPLAIGLYADNTYTIEVVAYDVISHESRSSIKTLNVSKAVIKFSDISEPDIDLNSGNGSITANIYTDTDATVTFDMYYIASGSLDVYVGSRRFHFGGRTATTFTAPIAAGDNTVRISFTSSYAENIAELSITSATGHMVGSPSMLSISF